MRCTSDKDSIQENLIPSEDKMENVIMLASCGLTINIGTNSYKTLLLVMMKIEIVFLLITIKIIYVAMILEDSGKMQVI